MVGAYGGAPWCPTPENDAEEGRKAGKELHEAALPGFLGSSEVILRRACGVCLVPETFLSAVRAKWPRGPDVVYDSGRENRWRTRLTLIATLPGAEARCSVRWCQAASRESTGWW